MTTREKILHVSKPESSATGTEPGGRWAELGLISGTGATLRSGRVRVFARLTVVPEEVGSRGVGIGMSLVSYLTREAMLQL